MVDNLKSNFSSSRMGYARETTKQKRKGIVSAVEEEGRGNLSGQRQ